jgi:hypothetical protein
LLRARWSPKPATTFGYRALEADDGGSAANEQADSHQKQAANAVEDILKHI